MVICIAGESGSGKTTSCRNLPANETLYIDCDKKGLSWKGWREQYCREKRNYIKSDDPATVLYCLQQVNSDEKYKHFKYVVIDTINGIMVADEIRRMNEKNYDKWMDLAASVYKLVDFALTVRDDLTVIFLAHTQTDHDDNGFMFTRIKTSGKKLDKIVLESKFTTVLLCKCSADGKHYFETQARYSTAKSPMGAFEFEIDNDIVPVIETLREY